MLAGKLSDFSDNRTRAWQEVSLMTFLILTKDSMQAKRVLTAVSHTHNFSEGDHYGLNCSCQSRYSAGDMSHDRIQNGPLSQGSPQKTVAIIKHTC